MHTMGSNVLQQWVTQRKCHSNRSIESFPSRGKRRRPAYLMKLNLPSAVIPADEAIRKSATTLPLFWVLIENRQLHSGHLGIAPPFFFFHTAPYTGHCGVKLPLAPLCDVQHCGQPLLSIHINKNSRPS